MTGATPYQQFFSSVNGDAALKILLTAQKEGGLLYNQKGRTTYRQLEGYIVQIISRTSYSSLKFKVKNKNK